jgi:hypothetical protein
VLFFVYLHYHTVVYATAMALNFIILYIINPENNEKKCIGFSRFGGWCLLFHRLR